MRFDPKTVNRWSPVEGQLLHQSVAGWYVNAADYDKLLALYEQERKARQEDAKDFGRQIRDAYAEGAYNARNARID